MRFKPGFESGPIFAQGQLQAIGGPALLENHAFGYHEASFDVGIERLRGIDLERSRFLFGGDFLENCVSQNEASSFSARESDCFNSITTAQLVGLFREDEQAVRPV